MSLDRHLWRLAGRIADRIARLNPRNVSGRLDHASWLAARRLESRLDGLASRHWQAARKHLGWQLTNTLRHLQTSLRELSDSLLVADQVPDPPSQRDLYEELLATRDEFDDFEFDLREQTLSVTTGAIELAEIVLGRFRIGLNLADLAGSGDYTVIAETPVPSASRSDATHPHVLDNRLCEGDAGAPLQCALRTGRLCDFFQIIEQTLQTYNPESAYATFDKWEERSFCHACGDHVSEYSSYYCETCDEDTCAECQTSCSQCGTSACDLCLQRCEACAESLCAACLKQHPANCDAIVQP